MGTAAGVPKMPVVTELSSALAGQASMVGFPESGCEAIESSAPEFQGQSRTSEVLDDCAICFETVQRLVLPCDCKVNYCTRCWDRALAQSFQVCSKARCPTCRSAVRADFDAETRELRFSRETRDTESNDFYNNEIERLAQQAKPAQISILRDYGRHRPWLHEIAQQPPCESAILAKLSVEELTRHIERLGGSTKHGLGKIDLLRRLSEAAGGSGFLACYWAGSVKPQGGTEGGVEERALSCVCGSTLSRCSGKERVREMFQKQFPSAPPEQLDHFLSRYGSGIVCDLCEKQLPQRLGMWTCSNGTSTVLHPASYDVCDVCFARHACGVDVAASLEGYHYFEE